LTRPDAKLKTKLSSREKLDPPLILTAPKRYRSLASNRRTFQKKLKSQLIKWMIKHLPSTS
jgi:hypothetical protein